MLMPHETLLLAASNELFDRIRWWIICEIEPVSLNKDLSPVRYRKFMDWMRSASFNNAQMQILLRFVMKSIADGKWYFDDLERIAMHDPQYGKFFDKDVYDWIEKDGVHVPKLKKNDAATAGKAKKGTDDGGKRKPRKVLRPIRNVASCPYSIDLPSNTITYRPKGKSYRIPRGDASVVVNRLVRGMIAGIRKKRSWLVRFTQKDERILHRAESSTEFYKECIRRTSQTGDGNQKYGDTAQLNK